MKILMLSSSFPCPSVYGGTPLRTFHLMKYLSDRHKVTLVTQRSENITDADLKNMQKWVQDLVVFPKMETPKTQKGLFNKAKRWQSYIQQGTPSEVLSQYSPAMQTWINEAVKSTSFDVVTSEDSINEIYVRSEWQDKMRTVVNIHSSVYGEWKLQLSNQFSENDLRDSLKLPWLRRYEERYCSKFSVVVATTTEDRKQLKAINPEKKISVIPNGVDLSLFPKRSSDPGGEKLVFVGVLNNPANVDAVRFFSLEVFPELRLRYPNLTLQLVGANPVPEVLELAEIKGITVIANVPSVLDYLHGATIYVSPLRMSSGIQNKTLQAMAAGVPIVASDRGLSGISVDGADVPLRAMRANTKEEYIYAIGRLLIEPKLREKLSGNARSLIEKEYTWERAGALYEKALSE